MQIFLVARLKLAEKIKIDALAKNIPYYDCKCSALAPVKSKLYVYAIYC